MVWCGAWCDVMWCGRMVQWSVAWPGLAGLCHSEHAYLPFSFFFAPCCSILPLRKDYDFGNLVERVVWAVRHPISALAIRDRMNTYAESVATRDAAVEYTRLLLAVSVLALAWL